MNKPHDRYEKRRLKDEQKVESERHRILQCFVDLNGKPDAERPSLREMGR